MTRPTKHLHLLPIVSFLPLIAVLLTAAHAHIYLDPFIVGLVSISYVAINVIYRHIHGTLNIGYVVEYSLVALLVYFVLTLYS